MTLVLLVSNVRVVREYWRGSLEGFATPPRWKGQKGSLLDEAWCEGSRGLGFSTQSDDAAQATQGSCGRESRGRIGTKKLDLKSNCGSTTA